MDKSTNDKKEAYTICIKCKYSEFPGPKSQCHVFGGLICTVTNTNVGKYDECYLDESLKIREK